MKIKSLPARTAVFRFCKSRSGVAAVEFALILPFMLLLYLGAFQISQAIATKRQVVLAASTVANIVTQYSSISASQTMPDILNAAVTVLTPYSASNAVVRVSSITINSAGVATVVWSQALHGPNLPTNQVITVPSALDVPNTSLIYGETTYPYTPIFDFLKLGSKNLYFSIFMLPRSSTAVALVP